MKKTEPKKSISKKIVKPAAQVKAKPSASPAPAKKESSKKVAAPSKKTPASKPSKPKKPESKVVKKASPVKKAVKPVIGGKRSGSNVAKLETKVQNKKGKKTNAGANIKKRK